MSKVRILGRRELLTDVLRAVQDTGVLHLAMPPTEHLLQAATLTAALEREFRNLRRMREDLDIAISRLGPLPLRPTDGSGAGYSVEQFAIWARLGFRVRRRAERLHAEQAELEEERALISKYQHLFSAFRPWLEAADRWPNATAYHVLLKGSEAGSIPKLRASLRSAIGERFELYSQHVPTGEIALLVIVSTEAAPKVERLLQEARVQEIPIPAAYGRGSLAQVIPRMVARVSEIPAELDGVRREREAMAEEYGAELQRVRRAVEDRLRELDAIPHSSVSGRAFVIEGWLPAKEQPRFTHELEPRFEGQVVVSEIQREDWTADDEAPVVLHNPRLFRPFEIVIKMMPLPHYGTIDPTPFVAVFFPAFFGLMLGDIGYGVILGALALVLHLKTKLESLPRAVSEIAGACAVFTVIAGLLYGEFFGDLGRRWLGLRPLAFDREEALVPFLLLAVAIGAVHVLLGLGLGVFAARHHPKRAVGRGVSALTIVLIIFVLLAVVGVLPRGFFTPAVIGILIAFPVLIVAEGFVAPLELLSTLGNILSYARIMALGVASVMLAVVANRMVGAIGSVAVGVMFALLFHLVNFAIGLFSPTIHALRLQYVEFFGKFYSPGGVRYEPFRHWTREGSEVGAER